MAPLKRETLTLPPPSRPAAGNQNLSKKTCTPKIQPLFPKTSPPDYFIITLTVLAGRHHVK